MPTLAHYNYVIIIVWLWTKLTSYFPKIKFKLISSPKEEPLLTKLWPTFFGFDSCQMLTLVHSICAVLIVWLWTKLTSYFPKIKFKLISSPKEEPLLTKLWPNFCGLDSDQMLTLVHSICAVLIVWLWTKLTSYFPKINWKLSSSPKEEPLLTKLWPTFFGLDSSQMPTLVHYIYVVLIVWLWTKLTSYFPKIKWKLSSSRK
jgi:aryl carrier-like protein